MLLTVNSDDVASAWKTEAGRHSGVLPRHRAHSRWGFALHLPATASLEEVPPSWQKRLLPKGRSFIASHFCDS